MVQHIQTIRRLLSANCVSIFDHFVGLPLKWLTLGKIFRFLAQAKGKSMSFDLGQ